MKLAAHPLVVAVALGLIDAGALAALDDTPKRAQDACESDAVRVAESASTVDALSQDDGLDDLVHEVSGLIG